MASTPPYATYSLPYIRTSSINHNPPNVATKPEPASAEPSSPATRVHNRKSPNWRQNEDIALCDAWVRRSENLIIGIGQTGKSLWLQIFEDFCEKIPGTARTKKGLENRWTAIQDNVSKWRVIMNRFHRNRQSGTHVGNEWDWGACYQMFKDEHAHNFKFYHCWEILQHSAKWNVVAEGKNQGRSYPRSERVNATPPPASPIHDSSNIGLDHLHKPASPIHDSSDSGLNDLHKSASPIHDSSAAYPSAGIHGDVVGESPPSFTPTGPTPSSLRSEPLECPLESKSTKNKRHRSDTCGSDTSSVRNNRLSDQVSEWRMFQNSQFQIMQETNKTQFEANVLLAFHLVKKTRLEQLQISIAIVQAIGDTEEKMISRAPHLFTDEVLARQTARFKQLQDIEREYYEIRRLEYSPGGWQACG